MLQKIEFICGAPFAQRKYFVRKCPNVLKGAYTVTAMI
jgi:hypothetical protein